MLHVVSVCIPCCMLLRVIGESLKPVKLLAPCKRTQHCWKLLRPFARRFKFLCFVFSMQVMWWKLRKLFLSNFALFTTIPTHNLGKDKWSNSPEGSFGKTKHTSWGLLNGAIVPQNFFLNSWSLCNPQHFSRCHNTWKWIRQKNMKKLDKTQTQISLTSWRYNICC